MYTATITKKEILEQHNKIILTVKLICQAPTQKQGKQAKQFVLDNDGQPKKGKDGKPKEKKPKDPKVRSKTIYFKFDIGTTWEQMQAEIKQKVKGIEQCESDEIPIGIPLDMN